jgi:hypothetical protein
MNKNNKSIEKLGEISINKYGSEMKIIEYQNFNNITIQFSNGYVLKSNYKSFVTGSITSPYDKTICNVGFKGEGKYSLSLDRNINNTYYIWRGIIRRCYDESLRCKYPTYKDCTVCEEWLNFQTFAKWYEENYYAVDNQNMEIDKDILFKGNKVYSPKTCVFVPNDINALFVKANKIRGEYPIGVRLRKDTSKYIAECCSDGTQHKLGSFNTPEDAFHAYKSYKENVIKQKAEIYKHIMPEKLYIAMINYQVEITD